MGGPMHPVSVECDVKDAQRRLAGAVRVRPQAGRGFESVQREEPPTVARHDLHRREDELEHRFADEVVEVDPDPAGFDPLTTSPDLPLEFVRALEVDPEQAMAVRSGTRATAARL